MITAYQYFTAGNIWFVPNDANCEISASGIMFTIFFMGFAVLYFLFLSWIVKFVFRSPPLKKLLVNPMFELEATIRIILNVHLALIKSFVFLSPIIDHKPVEQRIHVINRLSVCIDGISRPAEKCTAVRVHYKPKLSVINTSDTFLSSNSASPLLSDFTKQSMSLFFWEF